MKTIVEFVKKFWGWIVVIGIIMWRIIKRANYHNSNADDISKLRRSIRDDADRGLRRAIRINRHAEKQLARARGDIERLRELDYSDSEALIRARRAIDIIRAELEIREEYDRFAREALRE